MGTEQMTAQEIYEKYKDDMLKLIAYLPWLKEKSGKSPVAGNYDIDGLGERSMSFPVYDGNLLSFVKDAESTQFMDRNYVYVINCNGLRNPRQEKEFVKKQDIYHISNVGGVLAKYVIEGRIKAGMWPEAVDKGIFLEIVTKLQEIYSDCLMWEKN